jgi:hypothetical protein
MTTKTKPETEAPEKTGRQAPGPRVNRPVKKYGCAHCAFDTDVRVNLPRHHKRLHPECKQEKPLDTCNAANTNGKPAINGNGKPASNGNGDAKPASAKVTPIRKAADIPASGK